MNNREKNFTMSEQPQHEVELDVYLIGKYPVTNREYQEFVKTSGHSSPIGWDENQYPIDKGDHPVVNISWDDANSYCQWLREQTGKNYRLPTEAEWEKAARGIDGRVWPWGNSFDSNKANTKEAMIGDTSTVGLFSKGDSTYGCSDMIGNVWEWCNDWFSEFEYNKRSNKVVKNPRGPNNGDKRVLRGGSFYRNKQDARCAVRRANEPNIVGEAKGFRVALSSTDKTES